tara:strand:- start:844 stop:1872 length:1029 start_codon:yes stop_codon:yes gene_type:complete
MTYTLYQSEIVSGGLDIPMNDSNGVTDTITIKKNNSTVSGISVTLVDIRHTWIGDLKITLTKENPNDKSNSKTIVLMDSPGSGAFGTSGDDFENTMITDNATDGSIEQIDSRDAPWPDMKFTAHDGTNQTFLDIFNGEDVSGIWSINLVDQNGGDSGTLYRWALGIESPEEDSTTATSCFTGEAKVKTDQGLIKIKDVTIKNTINNKKIKGISKTIWPMDKIVVIEKHAFGHNYPSTKTKVAPTHQFLINGKLQPIYLFINKESIYTTKYKNEYLYNIIIGKKQTMNINNMEVECLDPKTLIAKVFDGSLDVSQKNRLIKSLNNYHNQLKKKPNKTIKDYRV